uniref:Copper transport protein n=1 Tax=Parastrongyloides trichosuri TaxID=131310 RepID=A0A0N4Z122_PARTI
MDHNNHHNHDMIGTTTIPTSINDMDHSNHHNMDHSNHHNMDHSNHHNMDHQHHHSMDHSNHHSMKMWFHGGTNEVILFDFWTINSLNGLLFSCLLIFISAACYEGLKWFRVYLQTESSKGTLFHIFNRKSSSNADKEMHRIGDGDKAVPLNKHCCSNDECPSNQQVHVSDCKSRISKESPCMRLLLSFLYVLQLTLAYCLMLITMTYNIYLGAAVVLGAGLGNYLFSGIECSKDKNQIQKYAEDACH